jgi:2,3-bisphosphoglycerate-independent phosphoglycerate mutase
VVGYRSSIIRYQSPFADYSRGKEVKMQPTLISPPERHVLLFFMDGIGVGGTDPAVNPFVTAALPHLNGLLGEGWYARQNGRFTTDRATFIATDACLDMDGRPQSATGQATILTGRNIPQQIGQHYGPKPNKAVAAAIKAGTLFHEVVAAGGRAALLTPYPDGYFAAIESGRRLYSAVPLAAVSAGISLMTANDLRNGRAVSPDFTAAGWRSHLGYDDIPQITSDQAGQQLARLAPKYHFSFFEHWPSDRAGHRGSLAAAAAHLEHIDATLGGLLDAWNDEQGLLIITSDHGNIEEKDHRQHTFNPVPTILVGRDHAALADQITDLADIAKVVRHLLGLAVARSA